MTKEEEKLLFKALPFYLPFSLKVIMEGKKCNVAWMSTKNISIIRPNGMGECKRIKWEYAHLNIKPLLIPLSHLTEEIEHKGERFVPYTMLQVMELEDSEKQLNICVDNISFSYLNEYWVIEKLLEWHFDIYGLIDKGLALDKTKI